MIKKKKALGSMREKTKTHENRPETLKNLDWRCTKGAYTQRSIEGGGGGGGAYRTCFYFRSTDATDDDAGETVREEKPGE